MKPKLQMIPFPQQNQATPKQPRLLHRLKMIIQAAHRQKSVKPSFAETFAVFTSGFTLQADGVVAVVSTALQ